MIQETLFATVEIASPTETPRCRMCDRPAYWSRSKARYLAYCTSGMCTNRTRLCQSCKSPFEINAGEAGTKYCSTRCKRTGYTRGQNRMESEFPNCAWCGKRGDRYAKGGGGWPYICRPCMEPIKQVEYRLKKHHVSVERAHALLIEPGCECCGIDIVSRFRNPRTGKTDARLVVDHDHSCCPGGASCGECVRGLLCSNCNIAAGMLRDDPDTARAMVKYLEVVRDR